MNIYREAEREFSAGDRIQFTAPYKDEHIANRQLGTIEQIDAEGNLQIRLDSGREVDLNLRKHPHLDYGYAVTSHSGQGTTADRVLVHVDTENAHEQLINSRLAYVSVSRGRYDAQIFTNDAEKLGDELSRDVSKYSAIGGDESLTKLPERSGTSARKLLRRRTGARPGSRRERIPWARNGTLTPTLWLRRAPLCANRGRMVGDSIASRNACSVFGNDPFRGKTPIQQLQSLGGAAPRARARVKLRRLTGCPQASAPEKASACAAWVIPLPVMRPCALLPPTSPVGRGCMCIATPKSKGEGHEQHRADARARPQRCLHPRDRAHYFRP